MRALEGFELTLTFCFTPESCGVRPDHTSAPQRIEEFAEFCARMIRRYAPAVIAPLPESAVRSVDGGMGV
jgi:beta-xylosidase